MKMWIFMDRSLCDYANYEIMHISHIMEFNNQEIATFSHVMIIIVLI